MKLFRKAMVFTIICLFIGASVIPSITGDISTFGIVNSGKTLYVGGSGPGNYSEIQDAIDDAGNGDTVFVYGGFYQENVVVNKSIILQGEDKNTTIINGNFIEDTIWVKISSVKIKGLSIMNSINNGFSAGIHVAEKKWYYPYDPPQTLSDICISNCIIYNNNAGIRLLNVMYIDIFNCKIQSNMASSIYLLDGSYIYINKCDINENGKDFNGRISGGISISEPCNNINISNCKLKNNIVSGLTISSIAYDINIFNNTFENNTDIGISVHGTRNESSRNILIKKNFVGNNGLGQFFDAGIYLSDVHGSVIIKNNVVSYNNEHGIYLLRSSANLFTDNIIKYNLVNGFYLCSSSANLIENNFITNNTDNGIYLDLFSSNNDICDNIIDDNNDGICLDRPSNNSIFGNNINNNNDGINISSSRYNTIIGNTISKNDYGVNLSYSFFNIVKENNFVENHHCQAYLKYSRYNQWIRNYWDDWNGICPKFIWGKGTIRCLTVPWFNIDWQPAKEPYDIDI